MSGSRSSRTAAVLTALLVLALPACRSDGTDHAEAAPTGTTTSAPPEPVVVEPVVISTDPPLDSVDVDPVTPLHVNVGHGELTAVTVTDEDGVVLPGGLDADGTTWTAAADLAYGTTYAVEATAVDASGTPARTTGTISTVRPRTLTLPTVYPGGGSVGVGQPVSVTFDEDVTDRAAVERQLRVTSTPPVVGSWSWLSDRTVHYRPEQYWPAHTHVAVDVDVYGLDVGDGVHGQQSEHVEFDIGPRKVAVVDATELQLRLYVDDELVRTMPTSLGNRANQTPTGTYVVMGQSRHYTMDSSTYGVAIDAPDGYRTDVEYASRLSNSGIFVHAAPWSVRDQGRRNVSHGCLNVSTADAGWFYENFGRGDVVEVGAAGSALQVWDGFGDWNSSWADWRAGSALGAPAA